MASCDIKLPEDFLLAISKLQSNFDQVAETVLKAGAEVVLSATKTELSRVVGKNTKYESRSTGQLEEALGLSPVWKDRNGNLDIHIGFDEPRNDGLSNAMVANILEYGKHNQPAKPFLKPAKNKSKNACIEKMKNTFDEEVSKL